MTTFEQFEEYYSEGNSIEGGSIEGGSSGEPFIEDENLDSDSSEIVVSDGIEELEDDVLNEDDIELIDDIDKITSESSEDGGTVTREIVYIVSDKNNDSVSSNYVILDAEQYSNIIEYLDIISKKETMVVVDPRESVSQNLVSIKETQEGLFLIDVLLFSMIFGFFVKETVFKGW